jgi:chemotaxis protein methyltransferase CheR
MREDFKHRYFAKQGMTYELSPKIRSMVKFQQFNLVNSFALLGKFDLILCRNVLIYFSDEIKRNVYAKLVNSLHPDGLLSIGSSESPRGVTDALSQALFGKAVLYRPNRGVNTNSSAADRFLAQR